MRNFSSVIVGSLSIAALLAAGYLTVTDGTQNKDGVQVTVGNNSPVVVNMAPQPPAPLPSLAEEAPLISNPIQDIVVPLIIREGYSEEPYMLNGINHVCYGHQTPDIKSKTPLECIQLLAEDIGWSLVVALDFVGNEHWESIGVRRQGVIIELAYLMGRSRLMTFVRLRQALRTADWTRAREEIQDSLLHLPEQIGQRELDKLKERL